VSGTRPALRGRVPSPYGGVAPRGDTPNCAPVERVPALLPPDPRRSAFVYAGLCEDLRTARGPGTLIRHGPEHSASLDACPPPWAAGGPAHPGRCPHSLSGRPRAALRCLGGRRDPGGHPADRGTGLPPLAHDRTARRLVRPQDRRPKKGVYGAKKTAPPVPTAGPSPAPPLASWGGARASGGGQEKRRAAATPSPGPPRSRLFRARGVLACTLPPVARRR